MSNLTHQEILKKTIGYCVKDLEMEELKLEYIGNVPKQPDSYKKIISSDELPSIITFSILRLFAPWACKRHGLDAVNYFAHFGEIKILKDLISIGSAEYGLEWLVSEVDYIKLRQKNTYIISYEELLEDILVSFGKNYSKKRIKILKKRIGISEIMYNLIDKHHQDYEK